VVSLNLAHPVDVLFAYHSGMSNFLSQQIHKRVVLTIWYVIYLFNVNKK